MLKFYYHDLAVCAQKVRIVLCEKDLDWEPHPVNLQTGEQFLAEYKLLNANSVVPTIVHDGIPIIESTIINEYLEDAFKGPPLRPDDPLNRAKMRQWGRRVDDGAHGAMGVLAFSTTRRHELKAMMSDAQLETHINNIPFVHVRRWQRQVIDQGIDAPQVEQAIQLYDRLLSDMEFSLQQNVWLAGPDYSLADIGLAPYITHIDWLGMSELWSDRPRVAEWYDRLSKRPAYRAAITEVVSDAAIRHMRKFGGRAWPTIREKLTEAINPPEKIFEPT